MQWMTAKGWVRSGRRHQAGMTLIEILFVLVLLAVVMGLVASNLGDKSDQAKSKAAAIEIQQIVNTLDLYKLEVGRYPTQSEGLQALITAPSGASRWNGPYWKKKEVPKDPWGNEYRYAVPGKNGAQFDVMSLGADGQEGGEGPAKDIHSSDL